MTMDVAPAKLDLGKIMSLTLRIVHENFGPLALIALLCVGLTEGLASLIAWQAPSTNTSGRMVAGVGQAMMQAAIMPRVVAGLNGAKIDFKQSMGQASGLLFPFLGINILAALGIGLGCLLLVVPGLILACGWSVATAARAVEGPGVHRALSRSMALTKGRRWGIFWLGLGYLAVVVMASILVNFLSAALVGQRVTDLAAIPVLTAGASMLGAVGVACLYYELRRTKEGAAPDSVAAVFD
jgi:hypothetical protein